MNNKTEYNNISTGGFAVVRCEHCGYVVFSGGLHYCLNWEPRIYINREYQHDADTIRNSASNDCTAKQCDVCKKVYSLARDYMETQEFVHISFTGGYGSIFGDDEHFRVDICQHCLKEILGEYITRRFKE